MKKTVIIFLLILSFRCSSKEERIENKLMNCTYKHYKEQGKDIKLILKKYEQILINEKILSDGSAKSYKKVFEKIAVGEDIYFKVSKSLNDSIYNISPNTVIKVEECYNKIIRDSLKYDSKKFNLLANATKDLSNYNNINPSIVAKKFLSILSTEDFKLDYYKSRVLYVINNFGETKNH